MLKVGDRVIYIGFREWLTGLEGIVVSVYVPEPDINMASVNFPELQSSAQAGDWQLPVADLQLHDVPEYSQITYNPNVRKKESV